MPVYYLLVLAPLVGLIVFLLLPHLFPRQVVNGWYYLLDEKVGVHKHLKAVNKKDKKKTAARRPTLTSAASGSTLRSLPESGGEVFNLPPPKINRDVQWEQPQQLCRHWGLSRRTGAKQNCAGGVEERRGRSRFFAGAKQNGAGAKQNGGGEEEGITIIKESGSFGFTISSANPVCVNSVDKDGAAARTCLMEGDRILRLNGINVTMVTADQLAAQIRSCEGPVTLLVQRCKQRSEDDNNGRNTTHASNQAAGNTSFTMDSTDVRLDTPDFTCPLAPSDTSFTAEIIANLNKITMDTPTKDGHPAKNDTQEEKMEEQVPAVDVLCQENQTACVVDVLRSNTPWPTVVMSLPEGRGLSKTTRDRAWCDIVYGVQHQGQGQGLTLCQLEQSRQKAIHTILKSEEHFAAALRSGMQMYLPAVKKQLLPKEHYGKLVANMEKMEGLSRYFASQIGTSAESCLCAPPEAPVYVESVGHIYLGKKGINRDRLLSVIVWVTNKLDQETRGVCEKGINRDRLMLVIVWVTNKLGLETRGVCVSSCNDLPMGQVHLYPPYAQHTSECNAEGAPCNFCTPASIVRFHRPLR
ncbi:Regulator of G-protein signaling 4 [Branchiostoma belcheri]|nr:Regulator of G-protein signaling 4 [Branchiostoma belcheri]